LAKDRVDQDIGPNESPDDWDAIEWRRIERRVKNLRRRIYRATQEGQWNKVRSLTKLMLRSFSNVLLSVRKVTQENQGKRTAGIDNQLILTPKARVKLVRLMQEHEAWKVSPAKRIYIPKATGKQRPLGILTIKNRVAQAIVKNALEPSWEARFEAHSYGFRPGRSTQDAISQCWIRLNRGAKDRWVLDADVRGAFDNISHEFVLRELGFIPGRALIKQWLKAGYLEDDNFHDTISGVPQGGVISPLLANIALDGMQSLVGSKCGFIRYADDFVVTARSQEELVSLRPKLEGWLGERGLEMNTEKTRIVSIEDGFNFLGFNVRHYQGRCLVKPEMDKVFAFLRRIREWLNCHKQETPDVVILKLNPILRGWAQYYRNFVSSRTFSYVNHRITKMLWFWCKRRHPNKGRKWVKRKYFAVLDGRDWQFVAKSQDSAGKPVIYHLFNVNKMPIKRHIKVRGAVSPDDPASLDYWKERAYRQKSQSAAGRFTASKIAKELLEA
jgi:RNA-directed DNA polymerase